MLNDHHLPAVPLADMNLRVSDTCVAKLVMLSMPW